MTDCYTNTNTKEKRGFMERKKTNVAVIGLGDISAAHIEGLKRGGRYHIYAVCDTKTEHKHFAEELNCLFYSSYAELAKDNNFHIAIVLTPPANHYEVAKEMLINKKHVLIEKPGVLNLPHLLDLIATAEEHDVTVDVIFHWMYGSEVLYLEKHFAEYGKLLRIECNAYDPYTSDGYQIKPERVDLNGAWNDSGINILSMLSCFLDLTQIKLKNEETLYNSEHNLPIYANRKYDYNGIEVFVTADWRYNRNHKFTNFYFEKGTLYLHHTAQEIWFNAKRVESFYSENRLYSHYTNLFNLYEMQTKNHENTILLHKLLFQTLKNNTIS